MLITTGLSAVRLAAVRRGTLSRAPSGFPAAATSAFSTRRAGAPPPGRPACARWRHRRHREPARRGRAAGDCRVGETRHVTAPASEAIKVVRALRAGHLHDEGRQALLQIAGERIRSWGSPCTSVYAYMLHADELRLEAYAGRETEHTSIPVGKGVCGTAVAEKRDQNVADVAAIGNYLACNLFTKSELVVLIRRGDHILGQIDIDSDVPNGFGPREHAEVKEVADALAVLL